MMTRVRGDHGVILIALLWILTAIAVIALSFSRESFVEVSAARNARDLSDSYFIARAGISFTVYKLLERRYIPRVRQLQLEAPPEPIDLGTISGQFGDGVYDVEIQDESGKLNLNFVSEEQLRLIVAAAGIDKREGDVIVDSILDWRDTDNLHRINGAEDDYYMSQPIPYKSKNGRFDTVEELLLVRGVTRDYFYGHPEKMPDGTAVYRYGLWRFFTVYAPPNQRINVNFAPFEVLMSIPGMPPQAAQSIIERRKAKPFATIEEITRDLPVTLPPSVMTQLWTEQTGTYTLTASAHRENSRVRRVIRTVISIDPRDPKGYKVIYWNENVPVV
jgi:general secretion pathway protein K